MIGDGGLTIKKEANILGVYKEKPRESNEGKILQRWARTECIELVSKISNFQILNWLNGLGFLAAVVVGDGRGMKDELLFADRPKRTDALFARIQLRELNNEHCDEREDENHNYERTDLFRIKDTAKCQFPFT